MNSADPSAANRRNRPPPSFTRSTTTKDISLGTVVMMCHPTAFNQVPFHVMHGG